VSKVAVFGGAGFIGSHLVDKLLALGHYVIVIDDLSTGSRDNLPSDCNFKEMDIRNERAHQLILKEKFDIIFHLAAQINLRDSIKDPQNDASVNIMGSLNLIDAANKSGSKFIFSSTGGAIYSSKAKIPWSECDPVIPESPYGISKLAVEHYLRVLSPNGAILRLSNVYGPRQNPKGEAGVISIFLDNLIKGKPLKIFGDGFQTRDFVYVDDVVDAFILAMDKDLTGVYNVSTSDRTDINQIYKLLAKLADRSHAEVELLPAIEGELKHSALSYHKIKSMWGWRPKTAMYNGLKKTVDYDI